MTVLVGCQRQSTTDLMANDPHAFSQLVLLKGEFSLSTNYSSVVTGETVLTHPREGIPQNRTHLYELSFTCCFLALLKLQS